MLHTYMTIKLYKNMSRSHVNSISCLISSLLHIFRYARQVAEFFEFVKKKKEAKSAETSSDGKWKDQNIVLPQQGGLWIPQGTHFAESVQKSMEFKRAMSFVSA